MQHLIKFLVWGFGCFLFFVLVAILYNLLYITVSTVDKSLEFFLHVLLVLWTHQWNREFNRCVPDSCTRGESFIRSWETTEDFLKEVPSKPSPDWQVGRQHIWWQKDDGMCTEPHAIQRNNSEKWQQREEREVSGRKKNLEGKQGLDGKRTYLYL